MILAAMLSLAATGEALAAWHEARTRHFIIYSEQSPSELKAYAERLERFDAAVRRISGMEDPSLTDAGKVTIYVLPTVYALQDLYGRRGDNVLGFYSPRASGSVAFVSNRTEAGRNGLSANHVFQHEYLHHMMLSSQKTPYPAWMVEGYAEFYGTAEVQRDGAVRVGLPPQSRANTVLLDLGFNAEQMLTGAAPKSEEDRSSLYAKGWLLTHMLAFDPVRRPQLDQYLLALRRGEAPLAAARGAFGDLKQLDKDLDRYGRGSFRGVMVSPGPLPEVSIRRLSEAEDAIMPVRIRSDRGVNPTTASQVAADARRIAARFPTDSFVQGVLAEAEYDVKDYKAAIAAADRALAVDAKNAQALVYRGRALMQLGRADRAKAEWAEVRRSFVRANRADTENAEPLWLFYQSFLAAGERPSKSAIDGLIYAQVLAPHDMGLRFTTVRQLLIDSKPAEAEPIFAQIVFNPHINVGARPKLLEAMEKIRSRDSTAALDALLADRRRPGAEESDD
ncbi:hypothetical protein [Sphingomonas sp. LHG3406-1]|uniref:hypothetical protein n=1 Tax=Sphingomonas sp. LHG3406-1 TaxID=2804617 RepID=UPI00260C4A1D|nr:hypothetical protein [Sphingomonas sp. LHG3406-1]